MKQNKYEKTNQETLKKISEGKRVNPYKVMRLKCFDCCCWQETEVRLCPAKDCILWAFRKGKNPIKRVMTEVQKDVLRKRIKKTMAKNKLR